VSATAAGGKDRGNGLARIPTPREASAMVEVVQEAVLGEIDGGFEFGWRRHCASGCERGREKERGKRGRRSSWSLNIGQERGRGKAGDRGGGGTRAAGHEGQDGGSRYWPRRREGEGTVSARNRALMGAVKEGGERARAGERSGKPAARGAGRQR
jgi:hypothetical protein